MSKKYIGIGLIVAGAAVAMFPAAIFSNSVLTNGAVLDDKQINLIRIGGVLAVIGGIVLENGGKI